MLASARVLSALVLAMCCGVLATVATAAAAPIVVNLRVEGSTKTLFEGPVRIEADESPGIETKSSKGSYPCDVKDNGENGGFVAAGAPPTVALYDAATAQHLAFDATWFASINDFDIEQVGEDVANSGKNGEFWGYAVNFDTAEVGGCQVRLAPGAEVLWAYNFFGLSHLLSLSGPASVNAGAPFTVHVADGKTGQPIAGAAVGQLVEGATTTSASSPVTDANGNATVALAQIGTTTLKATQPESVRSNGLAVCVHNGNDGTCGTTIPPRGEPGIPFRLPPFPQPGPDVVRLGGVRNGHTYSRHGAPRLLSASIDVPAGGTLREVRLSLERVHGGRCFAFDGRRAAFVRARCRTLHLFKVAQTTSFSYLLPARLRPGRYVYVVEATSDGGANVKPSNGVSRVVFYVK